MARTPCSLIKWCGPARLINCDMWHTCKPGGGLVKLWANQGVGRGWERQIPGFDEMAFLIPITLTTKFVALLFHLWSEILQICVNSQENISEVQWVSTCCDWFNLTSIFNDKQPPKSCTADEVECYMSACTLHIIHSIQKLRECI